MYNFSFHNPTTILFGKDQLNSIESMVPANAKVLITYGGGSAKRNGLIDKVKAVLGNRKVVEFAGIEPNPHYETLMKAVEVISNEEIDFLLAVGGGSVIDGTKFISLASFYKGDATDLLKHGFTPITLDTVEKVLPIGVVLTLPATGSEMNSGFVLTRKETKEKLAAGGPALYPLFSILDPQVVSSIPENQIANGLVDAYVHVLEQYMTYPSDSLLQDRFAESILQTLIEVAPAILKDPSNYPAASNFMWSCTMALNGLIGQGVPQDWAVHMMGHELTALFGIDHARTLAIIAPSHYRYNLETKKEKLAQYAERIWGVNTGSIEEKAKAGIDKTEEFFHSLGIKTRLSEYTPDYSGTAQIISKRFTARGWSGLGEHKKVTPADVAKIVEMSY